jgi:hypothetical protein
MKAVIRARGTLTHRQESGTQGRPVLFQPAPVGSQGKRSFGVLADGKVDGAAGERRDRDGDHLAALVGHSQGPVATLDSHVLDVRASQLAVVLPDRAS